MRFIAIAFLWTLAIAGLLTALVLQVRELRRNMPPRVSGSAASRPRHGWRYSDE